MPEGSIVTKILNYLNSLENSCFFKISDRFTSGIPDIIGVIDGRFVGLEVKTKTGRARKLQLYRLRCIEAAGGIGAVVRSKEEVQQLLKREGFHGRHRVD